MNIGENKKTASSVIAGLYEKHGWTFILLETVLLYVVIYASVVLKWPLREYLRFTILFPVFQASVKFGALGSTVEGAFVTLMYFPIPVLEYKETNDFYVVMSAICMLVFINAISVYMGSVVGKNRKIRIEMRGRFFAREKIEAEQSKRGVMNQLMVEALSLVHGQYACVIYGASDESARWKMYGMKAGDSSPVEIIDFEKDHPLFVCAERGEFFASNAVFYSDVFKARPEASVFRAIVCSPVKSERGAHGALMLCGKEDDESFNQYDVDIVTEMCAWTAAVIDKLEEETNRLRELAKKNRMSDIFSRFASESVAQTLMENSDVLKGSEKEVTVIVTDIMGFTALSEKLSPREIVGRLNRYYSIIVDIIIEMGGTIDKFVGDCVIAYWGAPFPDPNHELRAVEAAVKIRDSIDKLNGEWRRRDGIEFNTGIGVHSCRVIAGGVGGEKKRSYTIMGDEVDRAMEMESLTRKYNERLLLSESAARGVAGKYHVDIVGGDAETAIGNVYKVSSNI